MAKKEISENLVKIKKSLEAKNIVVGFKEVKKFLMKNELKEIFISSNCPEISKKELENLSNINSVTLTVLDQANDELGIICKKPFNISAIGIKND